MKYTLKLFLGIFWVAISVIHAESTHEHALICRHHFAEGWSSIDSEAQRYAPDRHVDIGHFELDVTPDFKKRTVAGTATFSFRPIAKPLTELRLDAADLDIQKIEGSVKISEWENTDRAIIVTFAKPLPPNRPAKLKVTYACEPAHGLYFRTPEMGYDPEDTHLWTQGETTFSRFWYPCFDAPNEFLTSTITCRVPKDMVVLSNGRKASEKIDPDTGLKAVTWKQEKPHVTYLITLVAGHFKRIEEKHGDLSMSFWTTPSDFPQAANSFRETKQCMEYFEKEIGVPYPWAKYDQVCVQDFMWGGMENTTLSTLNNGTLFSKETENLRSSQGLVAHELAHQWFGDLVTLKDWSHTWLNEGFATYYTHLFAGHKDGRDKMRHGLYRDMKRITGLKDDTTPMVNRDYKEPIDMFRRYGLLSYTKGSWILHMLRSRLGPEVFRDVVKTYLERHRHGNVVTENLRSAIEERTGKSYDRFFDQYVYHAHHPELDIAYSWNAKTSLAKLTVKQVQKVDDKVLLFHVPLPVRFVVDGKKVNQTLQITKPSEDFYFPVTKAPSIVRIDPDLTVLAKIEFKPPVAMLHAQLADKDDALGRTIAIELLGKRKDKKTVGKLKDTLNSDSFHEVRIAASKALRNIGSDTALDALNASTEQKDARVRRQVIVDTGSFFKPESLATLKAIFAKEKNPGIRGDILRALAGHDDAAAGKLILQALQSRSFRHQLADASISAMRKQDDSKYVKPLLAALKSDEKKFTSRGFASGLKALAHLSRNAEDKSTIRHFLVRYVNNLNQRKSLGAIEALGTLGDPRSQAVLEKLADTGKETRASSTAESAIAKIQAGKKPEDALQGINKELAELKKANEKLSEQLEELKKRFEATDVPEEDEKKK